MVILDTNIVIDHLRQKRGTPTIYKSLVAQYTKHNLSFSVTTIQELYSGKSTRDDLEIEKLASTIKHINIYHLTPNIAKLAGQITRDLAQPIQFADAAIAATAIHYGASLATLNTKDFIGIPRLQLLSL